MHRRRVSDWPGTPTAESGSGTVTACDRRGRDCGNLNLPEPRGFIPVTVMMATVAVAVTERLSLVTGPGRGAGSGLGPPGPSAECQ